MKARKPTLYMSHTRDGHRIALWRHKGESRSTPVLLVHGLGSNRNDLDFPDDRFSVARFLNASGFDVWVVELRGAGYSNSRVKKLLVGWSIDDYIVHDLPAALRLIEDESGEDAIHWVGHSLGGMLAYPLMAANPRRFRSATTIGAPAMQRTEHKVFEPVLPLIEPLLRRVPCFWGYKRMLQLGSYAIELTSPIVGHYLYNAENCDPADLARIARVAIDDVPSGVTLQLLEWYHGKRMTALYGTLDPLEALSNSTTPLLVVAGSHDRLTPLEDVRIPYDVSAAQHKELFVCGKAGGLASNYGHVDMIFGRRAREEVFPRIRDWIVRHDVPAPTHPDAARAEAASAKATAASR